MLTALVVENFKLIADVWQTILKQEGFTSVCIVENGEEVIAMVDSLNPELILMDINLSGELSGFDLIPLILKKNPKQKICIISIFTGETYIDLAKKSGAMGYVAKNKSITEIKSVIREVLKGNSTFSL
jgi:DNA-binding NarL/FixJ family response regulator